MEALCQRLARDCTISRSTAPAVEPLSVYKQQNQSLIVSSVAGATELVVTTLTTN